MKMLYKHSLVNLVLFSRSYFRLFCIPGSPSFTDRYEKSSCTFASVIEYQFQAGSQH